MLIRRAFSGPSWVYLNVAGHAETVNAELDETPSTAGAPRAAVATPLGHGRSNGGVLAATS